ncbi:hypothetical protein [Haloarchaeobius sp. DYHT-AS-18]
MSQNVLLVALDSVRAARTSLLGYDRDVCGRCGPGVDAAVEDRRRDLGYV